MTYYSTDEWIDPVDFRIGNTIRMLRIVRGMSQQALAWRLNVTFQQVQKYEKAKTHIAASRLYDVARALDTPIEAFFETPETDRPAQAAIRDMVDRYDRLSPQFGYHEFVELNRAYVSIADPAVREALLRLVEEIASSRSRTSEEQEESPLEEAESEPLAPSLSGRFLTADRNGEPNAEPTTGVRRENAIEPEPAG